MDRLPNNASCLRDPSGNLIGYVAEFGLLVHLSEDCIKLFVDSGAKEKADETAIL